LQFFKVIVDFHCYLMKKGETARVGEEVRSGDGAKKLYDPNRSNGKKLSPSGVKTPSKGQGDF